MILKYADDATYAMAHEHEPTLATAAWDEGEAATEVLKDLGLFTASEKSENLLIPPEDTVGDLYRRRPSATRKGLYNTQSRDDQLQALRANQQLPIPGEEVGEDNQATEGVPPDEPHLPFKRVATLKILGVVLDDRLC